MRLPGFSSASCAAVYQGVARLAGDELQKSSRARSAPWMIRSETTVRAQDQGPGKSRVEQGPVAMNGRPVSRKRSRMQTASVTTAPHQRGSARDPFPAKDIGRNRRATPPGAQRSACRRPGGMTRRDAQPHDSVQALQEEKWHPTASKGWR